MGFAARSELVVRERGGNVDSKMFALATRKMELPFTR